MSTSSSPTLRILAVHGFCQSATTFRGRTAAIKNKLKKLAVFDYAQGPHELKPGEHVFVDEATTPGSKCSWWRVDDAGAYSGVVASVDAIRAEFTANGPYHGLFGFSQGGSFVALLLQLHALHRAARQSSTPLSSLLPPSLGSSLSLSPLLALDYSFLDSVRFALLFAAFIPRDPAFRAVYLDGRWPILQRTLHVMGQGDKNIAITASEELSSCFRDPTVLVHPGGHHVPSDKASRERYIAFIEAEVDATADGREDKAVGERPPQGPHDRAA